MLCRGHARTDEFLHRLLPVLGEDVEAIFRKVAEACVYAHGGWQDFSSGRDETMLDSEQIEESSVDSEVEAECDRLAQHASFVAVATAIDGARLGPVVPCNSTHQSSPHGWTEAQLDVRTKMPHTVARA